MIRITVGCILLLISSASSQVQRDPAPVASVNTPDNMAFCVFFQAMGMNPPLLHKVGLSSGDEHRAATIMLAFDARFYRLLRARQQGSITHEELIRSRDRLILAARTKLKVDLSQPGFSLLQTYILAHKGEVIPDYSPTDS